MKQFLRVHFYSMSCCTSKIHKILPVFKRLPQLNEMLQILFSQVIG